MRQIKFRAWDKKETKVCVCGDREDEHIENCEQCCISECGCREFEAKIGKMCYEVLQKTDGPELTELNENIINCFKEDYESLMQYTGLSDKNGKEIYEGDIVKRVYGFTKADKPKETIDEIVYKEDQGAFAFTSKSKIGQGWSRMYEGHKVYPYEVIGNIYENPELLKN